MTKVKRSQVQNPAGSGIVIVYLAEVFCRFMRMLKHEEQENTGTQFSSEVFAVAFAVLAAGAVILTLNVLLLSGSSSEEQTRTSVPQDPVEGRSEEVAPTGVSDTGADEHSAALVGEETSARRGEEAPHNAEVPEGAASTATEALAVVEGTSTTMATSTATAAPAVVEGTLTTTAALPPIPPTEAAVGAIAQTVGAGGDGAEQIVETEEGGLRKSPVVAESQEAAAGVPGAAEEGPSIGQMSQAAKHQVISEEDRRPLSQVLGRKSPTLPSEAVLEAALECLEGQTSRVLPPCRTASQLEVLARCQQLSPEETPKHSSGACQTRYRAERDNDRDVDVEALVDGMSKSLKVLKRLAVRARDHKQMWEAEFDFCEELEAKYKARETELQEEALASILTDAKARGVVEYKARPDFKEDLEQFGARCYKVGLEAGEVRGQNLASLDYAREAFETAVKECWRRNQDSRLDGVQFMHFRSGMERQLDLSSVAARLRAKGSFPTEPVTREAHPYLLP
ncbi:hypothetical protein Taro_031480, partial [Colocasia esculenta]|nr:hypothetical protein [Colocasia esculenta]